MTELADIRRANLRSLQKGPQELSQTLGRRYSYWRDLLADGSSKSFGEKVARDIESQLGLPAHWLDINHDRDKEPEPAPGLPAAIDAVLSALHGLSPYRAEQIANALTRFAAGRATKAEVTADLLLWLTERRGTGSAEASHTRATPNQRRAA